MQLSATMNRAAARLLLILAEGKTHPSDPEYVALVRQIREELAEIDANAQGITTRLTPR